METHEIEDFIQGLRAGARCAQEKIGMIQESRKMFKTPPEISGAVIAIFQNEEFVLDSSRYPNFFEGFGRAFLAIMRAFIKGVLSSDDIAFIELEKAERRLNKIYPPLD